MHEADRPLKFDGSLQRTIVAKRANIIDHRSPGSYGSPHDARLAGVDRDGYIDCLGDCLDNRENPVELFLLGYIGRTRPGRFAADIDDGSAFLRHCFCLAQRGVTAGEAATIRERVGCDVENPHHRGDVELKRTERQHGFIAGRGSSGTANPGN